MLCVIYMKQESWAITKTTARCAQYMGALKNFESRDFPHVYFTEICNGLFFRSIGLLRMCVYKMWTLALPVPEIMWGTEIISAVPGYAHATFVPKFLMGFCSDGPCECTCQIWSSYSFTRFWDNREDSKNLGSPWIRPRSLFSQIFHGLLFGWTLWISAKLSS